MVSNLSSAVRWLANAFFVASPLMLVACGPHTHSAAESQPKAGPTSADSTDAAASEPVLLLHAKFEPRTIAQIEIGDFHFTKGQIAPVHTHAAPALGYVSKGAIVYQVEGQPSQILKTGDAFFEPVGPQILHFDNASQTEEAVFTDFNFEQHGEPFIVFPTPPVNLEVDRRTLPTVPWSNGPKVSTIDVYAQTLAPGHSVAQSAKEMLVVGYVANGSVELHLPSGPRSISTGQSFDIPAKQANVTLANASKSELAKVVLFAPAP